ncbi:MAG TPA: tetratricopeptide repeat protein [Terriglobales bacterium]|nr:tetratricopeptide repeat protein [Terriglobales bacterium]
MGASKTILLLLALSLPLGAQTEGRHRTRTEAVQLGPSALVREAEFAIDRQDYAAAEPKLQQATAEDPKDYRAWFDLGFVYSSTDRKPQAIEAYRRSVELKPDVFESNLNLGVLLAASGSEEAEKYLRAATQLKPVSKPEQGQARAFLALGNFLESKSPTESLRAFQAASQLTPKDPAPHLSAGMLLEKQGDLLSAEKEFQATVELDPSSTDALAGLANVYMRLKRLPDAETALRSFLRLSPNDVNAHLQLGRVLRELGRASEARAEFEIAAKTAPTDAAVLRELAAADAFDSRFPEAEARYRELLKQQPDDPELRYSLGSVLLKQKRFAEAEEQLLEAVRLRPGLADAYGELAVAAAENKHYELAIRALDQRARYLPEMPGTCFLRATSYDNLRAYPQAADAYHRFLELSGGKYPEQEWQARHRLLAIEPKGKRKK